MNHALHARPTRHAGHDSSHDQDMDPVRRMVHAILAVYLAPALLAVLVVGGAAIVGGHVLSAAERGSRWLLGKNSPGSGGF